MYIATTWPISKSQNSYIEDTSDNAKVKNRTFLVSIDVTSLYSSTQENKKGIEWVCGAYENLYEDNPPIL